MWYKDLFKKLEKLYDEKQSIEMSSYMKNKFIFLGIKRPQLNDFFKPYLKESKNYEFNFDFVDTCWKKDYREAQYLGITYLISNQKKLKREDITKLQYYITNKSWWETVDSIDYLIGEIVLKNKDLEELMLTWSKDNNIWIRRVSIDFQQKYKEQTNTELLETIIINNLNSNEFFINKSIGWSLREYSKTNPKWVIEFLNKYKNKLNKLSIKEASKYII